MVELLKVTCQISNSVQQKSEWNNVAYCRMVKNLLSLAGATAEVFRKIVGRAGLGPVRADEPAAVLLGQPPEIIS